MNNPEFNDEPLVDARTASRHLRLPLYYLKNSAKREALRIPHYHIGHLLRFRLSELDTWLMEHASVVEARKESTHDQ